MILPENTQSLVSFYKGCDKFTFIFSVLMMSRLLGFISLPQSVIYITLILYAAYNIFKGSYKINVLLALFLIYIPLQLLIVEPDPVFRSWERYILFIILLICVSPLLLGKINKERRKQIFQISMVFCAILGIGSFFARYMGINYMHRGLDYYFYERSSVGTFGGLTAHSMLLGPVAGIGAIYCCYRSFLGHQKLYWILASLCMGSVMFSASRSALMATLCGLTIAIYKIIGKTSKFLQVMIFTIILACISFPIWGSALDAVIEKNEKNIDHGSSIYSRDTKWEARIIDFKSHPLFGTGFAALDINNPLSDADYNKSTGTIEAGSSWLIILSMTGIFGLVIILPILFTSFKSSFNSRTKYGGLVCGVYSLFLVHMIAEGYIFYGGSSLAFLLWLTIGVAYDTRKES